MSREQESYEDVGSPTEPDSDLQVRYAEAIDAMRRERRDAAPSPGEAPDRGPIGEAGANLGSMAPGSLGATCELTPSHMLHRANLDSVCTSSPLQT